MRTVCIADLVILVLVAAALVVPRFAPRGEGFAAAAEAILPFMAFLLAAALVAIWLAAWTYRQRGRLPSAGHWLGFAPAAVLVVVFVGLVLFLRY